MGRSEIIHCIGVRHIYNEQGEQIGNFEYYAMSRLEIMQETIKQSRKGYQIDGWYYQTKTGARILGCNQSDPFDWCKKTKDVPKAKGIVPCICNRDTGCFICNNSGITTKRIINQYRPWQHELAIKEG